MNDDEKLLREKCREQAANAKASAAQLRKIAAHSNACAFKLEGYVYRLNRLSQAPVAQIASEIVPLAREIDQFNIVNQVKAEQ